MCRLPFPLNNVLFSAVGGKENLSLLIMFLFFPRGPLSRRRIEWLKSDNRLTRSVGVQLVAREAPEPDDSFLQCLREYATALLNMSISGAGLNRRSSGIQPHLLFCLFLSLWGGPLS